MIALSNSSSYWWIVERIPINAIRDRDCENKTRNLLNPNLREKKKNCSYALRLLETPCNTIISVTLFFFEHMIISFTNICNQIFIPDCSGWININFKKSFTNILTAIYNLKKCWFTFRKWIISLASIILSEICRPWIKTVWFLATTVGNIDFNIHHKFVEIHFY